MERVTSHPGEVLLEDFLTPPGMSSNALALRLRVAARRLHAILHQKRAVGAKVEREVEPLGMGTAA
jgi:addiction module HigA family antidote